MRKCNDNDLHVFVLSHDDILLRNISDQIHIEKVNLTKLEIEEPLKGEHLAENRFFLSEDAKKAKTKYVACVSARWDERFPKYPKLSELQDYICNFSEFEFIAPQSLKLNSTQFKSWIKNQDLVHPGMSHLINEIIEALSIPLYAEQFNIVMGNNFIVTKDVYFELLEFWNRGFDFLHKKYGFMFPYAYRCPKCGYESTDGVGRWQFNRHPAFLYERLTALFFASRPDLNLLDFKRGKVKLKKKNYQSYLMKSGPVLFRTLNCPRNFIFKCDHEYKSLGKS